MHGCSLAALIECFSSCFVFPPGLSAAVPWLAGADSRIDQGDIQAPVSLATLDEKAKGEDITFHCYL